MDTTAPNSDGSSPDAGFLALLTPEILNDPAKLLSLVRSDALERRRSHLPAGILYYSRALPKASIEPGSPIAVLLVSLELFMDGVAAEELISRIGEGYRDDVEEVLAAAGQVPPEMGSIDQAMSPEDGVLGNENSCAGEKDEAPSGPRRDWRPGDRIGRYRLKKRIGGGSFGHVWIAMRQNPEMTVAIKLLHASATDERSRKRFDAEAQALAFLDHPYIAKVHDAGLANGRDPYIAMEYIEGKPLTTYCDDHRLTVEQRLELVARIGEGVHHAHSRGIIHRDLKPGNILVTEVLRDPKELDDRDRLLTVGKAGDQVRFAVPKIVDFGMAKAISPSVRLGESMTIDLNRAAGTPEYMSPEQARHEAGAVGIHSDIFALGNILYESLAGILPLSNDELKEQGLHAVLAAVQNTPRPDPSSRHSSMAEDKRRASAYVRGEIGLDQLARVLKGRIRHLTGRALRLEPEKRFSSAAAMSHDIRNYLDDRNFVEAASEGMAERTWRHIKRYKFPYAAAGLIVLSLIGGIIGTRVQWQRAENAEKIAVDEARKKTVALQNLAEALKSEADQRAEAERQRDAATEAKQSAIVARDAEAKLRREAEDKLVITNVVSAYVLSPEFSQTLDIKKIDDGAVNDVVDSLSRRLHGDQKNVAEALLMLAGVYAIQDRVDWSYPCGRAALKLFEASGNTSAVNYVTFLSRLASEDKFTLPYAEVRLNIQKAWKANVALYGRQSVGAVDMLCALAWAQRHARLFDDAETTLRGAVNDAKGLPENERMRTQPGFQLAQLLDEHKRSREAAPLADEVYVIRRRSYVQVNIDLLEAGVLRADIAKHLGDTSSYQAHLLDAIEIGTEVVRTANKFDLGSVTYILEGEQASPALLQLLNALLVRQSQILGRDDQHTVATRQEIVRIRRELGVETP